MRLAWFILAIASVLGLPAVAQEPPPVKFTVAHFQVEGDNPLDKSATDAALAPFLGEYASIDGLLAAKDALEHAFAAAGFSFHRATLPPQALDSGVVILKVASYNVGDVKVSGNQHFSTDNIRASLPKIVGGSAPDLREVSRSLAVANQHPHKKLQVTLRDSEATPDSLDAVVKVQDQKPWNLFAGINNIGTPDTGSTRMQLGGMYSNLTRHDDVFSTSVTISPDNINNVMQFGAFYQVPIYPLSGWLSAFYVKSDVDVGNVQNNFDVSGAGDFLGLSFKRSLLGVGRYHHSLTVGLQDRDFDTNVFAGTILRADVSHHVRSRPLSFRYDGSYNWPLTSTSLDFYVDYTFNLDFGGHNRDQDYSAFGFPIADQTHAQVEAQWWVYRFGALMTHNLSGDFLAVVRMDGQFSDQPLIPGEQFGVGGERSVRGFQERTVAGDRGFVTNFELWSPPIERLDGLRLLGFVDYGFKSLLEPQAKQRGTDSLSSIGIGARWNFREMVAFSVDYGLPLAHADGEAASRGTSKWHLNLQIRY